jgi:D-3-phosphoglycerate dehydrogenase
MRLAAVGRTFRPLAGGAFVTTVEALVLDLLEWIGPRSRPYREVIDAWRTSCPRLDVWEQANDRGFVEQRHEGDRGLCVAVTPLGIDHLSKHRPMRAATAGEVHGKRPKG